MKSYSNIYYKPAALQLIAGIILLAGGRTVFHVSYYWLIALAGLCFLLSWKNIKKGKEKKALMANLKTNDAFFVSYEDLKKYPDKLYVGKGFPWENKHAQMMYELSTMPEMIPYIEGNADAQDNNRAIHGIGKQDEADVTIPLGNLSRHEIVAGTTGCGKTRKLELTAVQAVLRKEATIIIDMKGDNKLVDRISDVCKKEGRTFRLFSMAHPKHSETFNPLQDYSTPESLSSRIRSILPDSSEDFYRDAIWGIVNVVINASIVLGEKATLRKVYEYVFEDEKTLIRKMEEYIKSGDSERNKIAADSALKSLRQLAAEPEEFKKKLLTNLKPLILGMTNGGVGDILNPELADITFPKAISKGEVIYFYLPAMIDNVVAKNIGKLALQSLLFHIGATYAYRETSDSPAINVFVDEFYNCIFPGFVDLLNKSRGANTRVSLYMQTAKDMEAVITPAMAQQILANTNMKTAMEVPEIEIATMFSDLCGKVYIKQKMDTKGTTPDVKEDGNLFNVSMGERSIPKDVYLVEPTLLTKLPVGQSFMFSKSPVPIKLRHPLISDKITESLMDKINKSYAAGIS